VYVAVWVNGKVLIKHKDKVEAKFLHGSIMRHVVILTLTSSIGLVSLFAVDLTDLYFLTLLNDQSIIAGLGFALSIMFFNMSFSIGLSIAMSATVAQKLGEKKHALARSLALDNFVFSILCTAMVATVTWVFKLELLSMIGASGPSLEHARNYLAIILPSLPFLAIAMSGGALLRALGAPKLSMLTMLAGASVNVVLDPILIFGFDLAVEGAAIASVAARVTVGLSALYFIYSKFDYSADFEYKSFTTNLKKILAIALPAMATQLSAPAANAYMTFEMAKFGESYMSGWTITGRIAPVVFAVVFAVSSAIGPIYAQNYGAKNYRRVEEILYSSCLFITGYCLIAWSVFYYCSEYIVTGFGASGDAAIFIKLVAIWIGPAFIFSGFLFVANTAFNNLGYPLLATVFNFAKASIGTVPFVLFGINQIGVGGVFIGNAAGNLVFGLIALVSCFYVIRRASLKTIINV